MTRYFTTQEVLYLHQRTLERTGGNPGLRDLPLLEVTLNRPRAMMGGSELYPTLALKAAVLMSSLVANFLFLDGNKRMGLQSLDVFLRLNGRHLTADAEERFQFVCQVADQALTMPQMAEWIEAHSEALVAAAKPAPPRARPAAGRRMVIPTPPGQ